MKLLTHLTQKKQNEGARDFEESMDQPLRLHFLRKMSD